jgi:AcrR family transcriptional regulator
VQDITEAATLNRATFYDHYADKFALLECMVAARFQELLAQRGVRFDETCSGTLRALVLSVCDYLSGTPGVACPRQRHIEPHLESALIGVVRRTILEGSTRHPVPRSASPELVAAAVSWAIYGAVKEWVLTPNRCPSEKIVETVVTLLSPLFAAR